MGLPRLIFIRVLLISCHTGQRTRIPEHTRRATCLITTVNEIKCVVDNVVDSRVVSALSMNEIPHSIPVERVADNLSHSSGPEDPNLTYDEPRSCLWYQAYSRQLSLMSRRSNYHRSYVEGNP